MKYLNKIQTVLEKKPLVVLGFIIGIGLLLRMINLQDNIIFAYDQARDATRIMSMIKDHDIKLVGPETDIPGVFNGVLYYILLIPSFFISNFNLNAVSFFLILLNLTLIPLLYYLAIILFNNKYVGYVAGFLWATSFEQVAFAKFISNASLMSISATCFFAGLAIFLFQKKNWGLILSSVGYATAIHFNFYLIYLAIFYPIFFVVFKPKVTFKLLLVNLGIISAILMPFFVAEIKWHFAITKGLSDYFFNRITNPSGDGINLDLSFAEYVKRFTDMVSYSFFSFQKDIGNVITIALIIWSLHHIKKDRGIFLAISLVSTLPLFLFNSGVLTVQVINTSIFFAVTIAVAAGLYFLYKKNKSISIIILILFCISNFLLLSKKGFANNTVFASHPLTLKYEKQLVDYTYKSSNKEPFSICGIMNPLFTNTIWSYLYATYGKQTYGYTPTWAGQPQVMNKSYLEPDLSRVKNRFLIIEPVGIPDFGRRATVYLEDQHSQLIETKRFGEFTVQQRKLLNKDEQPFDSQRLQKHEIEDILRVSGADPRYTCFISY